MATQDSRKTPNTLGYLVLVLAVKNGLLKPLPTIKTFPSTGATIPPPNAHAMILTPALRHQHQQYLNHFHAIFQTRPHNHTIHHPSLIQCMIPTPLCLAKTTIKTTATFLSEVHQ